MLLVVTVELFSSSPTVWTISQTENEACPVILVGGGCILVDRETPLKGVSTIECPSEHFVSSRFTYMYIHTHWHLEQ